LAAIPKRASSRTAARSATSRSRPRANGRKTRKYNDKDGVEKYATEVVATEMQLLGSREGMGDGESRGGGGGAPAARPAAGGGSKPAPQKSSTGFDDMDDDIPF
jgi:single-strand DNA-binding protein